MKERGEKVDYEAKERRRKLLHSLIERKRREKMAVCYEQLKNLVPGLSTQGGEPTQKLQILEKTVEYILELKKKGMISDGCNPPDVEFPSCESTISKPTIKNGNESTMNSIFQSSLSSSSSLSSNFINISPAIIKQDTSSSISTIHEPPPVTKVTGQESRRKFLNPSLLSRSKMAVSFMINE